MNNDGKAQSDAEPVLGFPSKRPLLTSPDKSTTTELSVGVVVIAHDRREYLATAVESVLAQQGAQRLRGVVVVKNYSDELIDGYLHRLGAGLVLEKSPSIGRKAIRGVEEVEGDVICFLEDDDTFAPTKIREVTHRFESDVSLGYYQNHLRYVDADGRELSPGVYRAKSISRRITVPAHYLPANTKQVPRGFYAVDPGFNASSISIRRDVISSFKNNLELMEAVLDNSLMFSALASGTALLADNCILTNYRIHSSNVSVWRAKGTSLQTARAARVRELEARARDFNRIANMVVSSRRSEEAKVARAAETLLRLHAALLVPSVGRKNVMKMVLEPIRDLRTFSIYDFLDLEMGGLTYVISPHLATHSYLGLFNAFGRFPRPDRN